jgi:sigma-54 specific flagellar transcriptional regulator A
MNLDKLIIGKSKSILELKLLINKVANANSTVLILGETGTGKELVAEAVHKSSKKKGQFVPVNCAAIPSELLESELFGHEKGAFTGADKARAGRFEMSSGGTLFLDEIGDIPLPLQAKLLRALESKKIQKVGGGKEILLDLRMVCATHQNLEQKVADGSFRADLFYRINVFPINIPTLAERAEDISLISDFLLKSLSQKGVELPKLSEEASDALKRHLWPGNIRELKNVLERACILFPGKTVSKNNVLENLLRLKVPTSEEEQKALWDATQDLGSIEHNESGEKSNSPLPHPKHYADWFDFFDNIDLRVYLRDVEIVLIESALKKSEGTVSKASDLLKINRTTLIEKMKKLQINS